MKLLMLLLLVAPVQEGEGRMNGKKKKELQKKESRERLDRAIGKFASSIRAGENEPVGLFQEALGTEAGKIVMRDRAQAAANALRSRAERKIVADWIDSWTEAELKDTLSAKIRYFRAWEGQIHAVRGMLENVIERIPDERGEHATMRKVLAHKTAAPVLHTIVFRKYFNYFQKKRGRITDSEAAKIEAPEVAAMIKKYLENYLVQKSGKRYTVNSGEVFHWFSRKIPRYAAKETFHKDIDAFADRLEDRNLADFFHSYLGKDHIENAKSSELGIARRNAYDGLSDWISQNFRSTEEGHILRTEGREEITTVLAQVAKVQEGLKNENFDD